MVLQTAAWFTRWVVWGGFRHPHLLLSGFRELSPGVGLRRVSTPSLLPSPVASAVCGVHLVPVPTRPWCH